MICPLLVSAGIRLNYSAAVSLSPIRRVDVQASGFAAGRAAAISTNVASSRGRRTLEIHAPDRARLIREAVDTIESRSAAVDYVGKRPPWPARERLRSRLMRRVAILSRKVYQERIRPALERVRDGLQRRSRAEGRV